MRRLWVVLFFIAFSANGQGHRALAEKQYALGDFNEAIYHLRQLPESKEQQLKLAKSYEQTGNLKNALAYYKKLFTAYPEDVVLAYEYAKLLSNGAQYKLAEEILASLIEQDSLNPNFPYQLGLLKEQERDSLATVYFEKALQLDSKHIPAAIKVATARMKNKAFVEADSLLTAVLKMDDSHFQAWNLKALNYFYLKDYPNTIRAYNKLLELNRPSENVHQKLGYAYAQMLELEKAIGHYTIAINEYDDQNPETHVEIAKVFMSLLYWDKAERHLEIAMLLKEPQLEPEYTYLFELYHRQKKYEKAFAILSEAAGKYPGNEYFLYRLATTADSYFKDRNAVLNRYETYMAKFGETGNYRLLAAQRLADIKKELHMGSN